MEQHVKTVAISNIVLGSLGVLVAVIILIIFGGVAGMVVHDGDPDAGSVVPILGLVGGVGALLVAALSVPSVIAGVGLLHFRPWAQTLTIAVSILNLVHVPFGTAVGVYGLWVLFQDETKALFKAKNAPGHLVAG